MLIEGKNSVKEALISGVTIDKVMVCKTNRDSVTNEIVRLARDNKVKLTFEDKFLLDKVSLTGRHQGVLCFATEFVYSEIEDMFALADERGELPFLVLLDGITDPHNLGSIIRSAECSGVHGIVIPKNRAACVNDTVVKVSEGATLHTKVARVTNLNNTIRELKDRFVNVYAADMDGTVMYDARLDGALALVVGAEGSGVSRLTKELCDGVISIPMFGKLNSLNASVAAAVAIYEVVRQRTRSSK